MAPPGAIVCFWIFSYFLYLNTEKRSPPLNVSFPSKIYSEAHLLRLQYDFVKNFWYQAKDVYNESFFGRLQSRDPEFESQSKPKFSFPRGRDVKVHYSLIFRFSVFFPFHLIHWGIFSNRLNLFLKLILPK